MVKRAPMGFMGMRGKKEHDDEQVSVDNSYRVPNELTHPLMVSIVISSKLINYFDKLNHEPHK